VAGSEHDTSDGDEDRRTLVGVIVELSLQLSCEGNDRYDGVCDVLVSRAPSSGSFAPSFVRLNLLCRLLLRDMLSVRPQRNAMGVRGSDPMENAANQNSKQKLTGSRNRTSSGQKYKKFEMEFMMINPQLDKTELRISAVRIKSEATRR
jgi:hypothetical protein